MNDWQRMESFTTNIFHLVIYCLAMTLLVKGVSLIPLDYWTF